MPHYFFHLLSPVHPPVRDEEGMMFEDDAAARREGMKSLGDLLMEACSSGSISFVVSVQIERTGSGVIDLLTGELGRQSALSASARPPVIVN